MKHLTLTYSCRSAIDKNQAKPATTVKTQKNISSGENFRENIRPNLFHPHYIRTNSSMKYPELIAS